MNIRNTIRALALILLIAIGPSVSIAEDCNGCAPHKSRFQ